MKYLLDTHILLWAADGRLPEKAAQYVTRQNEIYFSSVNIWEIIIKSKLGRADFVVDAALLYHKLLDTGYQELPVRTGHVLCVSGLPDIHKDPFDRLLVAQAMTEEMRLITADETLAKYGGAIIRV